MKRSHDTVSVLGTGAIGRAVASTMLAAGRPTVVWNRTAARADPLVEAGASLVPTPEEALTAGALVVVTVTDYAAIGALLDTVDGIDLAGRAVVALVTGSPADARSAAARFGALGAAYLDGGIQAPPDAVGTPEATFLLSGSAVAYEEHRETLAALGAVRFVGERPDAAAAWDLALFGAWYDAQLGLLRAVDLAREAGIDLDTFAETLSTQLAHVPPSASQVVEEVRTATFPPGPASLAEHLPLLERLVESRTGARLGDGGLAQVVARVGAVSKGRASDGLTALIG